MVLLFLVAAGALTVAVLDGLLGEIQGALAYRHAVQALALAEAGAHYAVATINGTGGSAYAGETDRAVTHPTTGQIGLFDVTVRCSDGSVPATPSPCAAAPQPDLRVITSTGFVPNKTTPLGRRTVVVTLRQGSMTSLTFAVCGVDGVTLDRDTATYGNVGSDQNISLKGPPQTEGSLARIYAYNGQAGDATAGGTVSCSGSCGGPYNQVAGTTTNNYPGGRVCPTLPAFSCTPAVDASGDRLNQNSLTISAASGNTVLRDVTMNSNSTLTFETTSASEILEVHFRTLIVGQSSRVRITGPGKVVLHLAGRMEINQGTLFGVDGADADIAPGRLVVESCATDSGTDYAVEFHQTERINGIILAPNGRVQLDQASLSRGAVQARTVGLDRNTQFQFDTTSFAISGGAFNTLISWREQP
ncbi:MAG: hypothetical protein HY355_03155 [Armatimonadetes bacterium]|nr:hypothetical protein [Armatimonadota bacterium]